MQLILQHNRRWYQLHSNNRKRCHHFSNNHTRYHFCNNNIHMNKNNAFLSVMLFIDIVTFHQHFIDALHGLSFEG